MVRPPQTSGDEDLVKLAAYPRHPLLMGSGILRILRAGPCEQNRIRGERRSFQPHAAEGDPGGDFFDSIHPDRNGHVQGTDTPVESHRRLFLPYHGRIFRIFEIKTQKTEKSCRKIWSVRKNHYLCNPKTITRSVRITVSTQDSQSCNRGSIPLPSTQKEAVQEGSFFCFCNDLR